MHALLFRQPAPASALAVATLPPETAESDLLARAPAWLAATGIPSAFTHPQRRREWLAGRVLAAELLGRLTAPANADLRIDPDEFGRPRLRTPNGELAGAVSLSHGGGHVAALVVLGAGRRAGLDLEPERPKTQTLAARFLAPAELAFAGDDAARCALAWSLKETLYKLYGRRQLDFRHHLHLDLAPWPALPTVLPTTGHVVGRITHPTVASRAWTHTVRYERATPHCWLTYCVGAAVPFPSPASAAD
ncbi:MAG: 4'-phosphopantetheinyl transferase superfamily protein [Hymenobacteraceae bacterium]|nr:4'-phosphopantetheinyl transferase superfamily protein [Hymenobacteraceae bacterium]